MPVFRPGTVSRRTGTPPRALPPIRPLERRYTAMEARVPIRMRACTTGFTATTSPHERACAAKVPPRLWCCQRPDCDRGLRGEALQQVGHAAGDVTGEETDGPDAPGEDVPGGAVQVASPARRLRRLRAAAEQPGHESCLDVARPRDPQTGTAGVARPRVAVRADDRLALATAEDHGRDLGRQAAGGAHDVVLP